jgi:LPS sulfotransferase NodH
VSGPDAIFESVAEFHFEHFVTAADAARHYVCDEAFAAWLAPREGAGKAWMFSTLAGFDPALAGARAIVACAAAGEPSLRALAAARCPGREVFGLLRDLLPCCVARRPLPARRRAPAHRYVILCTPRSGSYYLCGLLESSGLGAPREHLRQSVAELCRLGHLDLVEYLENLAQCAAVNGWFGTKMISHHLFDSFARGLAPDALVDHAKAAGYKTIYLVREDKVRQAVSNWFARATDVWFQARDDRAALPRPDYDFAALEESYGFLRQQEQWMAAVASYMPQPLTVVYEELDREPARVLARVLAHLGADAGTLRLEASTRRQRDALSESYAQRFAAELRARGVE